MRSSKEQHPPKPSFSPEKGKLYTLFSEAEDLQSIFSDVFNLMKKNTGTAPGTVLKESATLDHLSIKENFLLAVSLAYPRKRDADLLVSDALEELDISTLQANDPFSSLQLEKSIQLQLQINFICNKSIIIIDDWLENEPHSVQEEWLTLLKHLAKEKECTFIVLTTDNTIEALGDFTVSLEDFHS